MSTTIGCGTAFSMAMDGYLVEKGKCGDVISMAFNGYLITIEPDDTGGFKIKPKKKGPPYGVGGISAPTPGEVEDFIIDRISYQDEEEIIFSMIVAFLKFARKHNLL